MKVGQLGSGGQLESVMSVLLQLPECRLQTLSEVASCKIRLSK